MGTMKLNTMRELFGFPFVGSTVTDSSLSIFPTKASWPYTMFALDVQTKVSQGN